MNKIIAALVASFTFAGAHAFSFDDAAAMAKNAANAAVAVAVPMVKDTATMARDKTCSIGHTAAQKALQADVKSSMYSGMASIVPDAVGGAKLANDARIETVKGTLFTGGEKVLKLAC